MGKRDYDLIIIGGGPAGYTAALRAAQLGLNTACIDQWLDAENHSRLGGTCMNAGCIPSKVLLDSSLRYVEATNDYSKHGIHMQGITIELSEVHNRKQTEVNYLSQGIATLFSSYGVQWLKGHGKLTGQHRVAFTAHNRKTAKLLNAEHIILAPGSKPASIDAAPVDGHFIVDSEGALNFDEVPKKLGIVGAGAIGLELGTVWQRFGADVLLLEAQKSFLAVADGELAQLAYNTYTSQGLQIKLGTRVKKAVTTDQGVKLEYLDAEGEKQACFDRVIIAVGRRPNTNSLYSDDSGLQLDERRFIGVDAYCRTNLPGVWAIGDAVRGPMLAHKGSEEGIMVVERLAGKQTTIAYEHVPAIIYTHPELAWVGPTEEQLRQMGIPYRQGRFPIDANGRARTLGENTGVIKLLAHAETDRLLAAHLFTPDASELIGQAMITLSFEGCAEDLARTMTAYPSLSEVMHEAALDVAGRSLHSPKFKQH